MLSFKAVASEWSRYAEPATILAHSMHQMLLLMRIDCLGLEGGTYISCILRKRGMAIVIFGMINFT